MNINEPIPDLDKKGLRQFGLVTAGLIIGFFGVLIPWLFDLTMPVWPWVISALLAIWAMVHPGSLDLLYRIWMRFGLVLGFVSSRIVLSILFYGVFTPVGGVMRLWGWNPMCRRWDKKSDSYRKISKVRDITHMENPF